MSKFRAWSKSEQKWVYVTLHPRQIHWSDPSYIQQEMQNENSVYFEDLSDWQQLVARDKNLTDVYVGDIVQWRARFVGDGGYSKEYRKPVEWSGQMVFPGNLELTEVIGNIQENPELLEQSNNNREVKHE